MSAQIGISLRVALSRTATTLPPAETRPPLWRVLHDAEMGAMWRFNVPEVFRLEPLHSIPLNREWQLFTYHLNPGMAGDKWRRLYGYFTAFTNNAAGYDWPKAEHPLADWVNMRDTNSPYLPKFDQPRICGGAIVTGRVEGSYLWLDTLDATKPPPAVDDVKPWHKFCALSVRVKPDGSPSFPRFPYCDGRDVIIPLITRQPVRYPLSKLHRWEAEYLPNPYQVYL